MREVISIKSSFYIINLDLDYIENKKYHDPYRLFECVMDQRKDNKMYYVLLDEIQEVEDFESVLNSFLGKGNLDVYVTGSNSKFLSTDIKTEFPDYSPHFKEVGGSIFDLSVIKASLDNTRQIKECQHNQYLHYLYLLIFLH